MATGAKEILDLLRSLSGLELAVACVLTIILIAVLVKVLGYAIRFLRWVLW